jgi:serine/threonine protein kinase
MKAGNSSLTSLDTTTPQIQVLAGGQADGKGLGISQQGGHRHFLQRFRLQTPRSYREAESMRAALTRQNPFVTGQVTGAGGEYPHTAYSLARISDPEGGQRRRGQCQIGQVVSEEALKGITRAGLTQTILGSSSTSHTGTQLHMAPELLAGKPASTRSDIYSLGVVLYQLLAGDFSRPVTTDWTRQISDSLLREDLGHCFAGDANERFGSAAELAKDLRALPKRRAELERREAEKAALERAAYRRGMMRTAGVAAVILTVIAGLALVALQQSRRATGAAQAKRQQRQRAEASERESRRLLYLADMRVAQETAE